jgi:hypothetical protein
LPRRHKRAGDRAKAALEDLEDLPDKAAAQDRVGAVEVKAAADGNAGHRLQLSQHSTPMAMESSPRLRSRQPASRLQSWIRTETGS